MSEPWLLSHATVVCALPEGPIIHDGAVAVDGTRIIAVGERQELAHQFHDAMRIDAGGGIVLPGLVNLHHHFYSALARGLDPQRPTADFEAILKNLWWRLDRALGPQEIRLSALVSCAECIRWGVTTVFDHHASPSFISGSLDVLAAAVEESGMRAVLCYEVSDRNGHSEALEGLNENFDFAGRHTAHPRIRGMLGLHASFTVSDASLRDAAQRRPSTAGCHIHLAEDRLDEVVSRKQFGASPLQRLLEHGLVDDRALLVHGVHLDETELSIIAANQATLIHNPESNQNNGVGQLDFRSATGCGCTVGLGTDGMSSAMLPALRSAFLGLRGGAQDPTLGFDIAPQLLATNRQLAQRFFAAPQLGMLTRGAPADLAVFDCPTPTPISSENLMGHILYGVSHNPARHTVCDGRFLLRDYRFCTLDPVAVAEEARQATPSLWSRFHELD